MRHLFLLFAVLMAGCYSSASIKAKFPVDESGEFGLEGRTNDPVGAAYALSDVRTKEKLLKACLESKNGKLYPMSCMPYSYQMGGGRGDAWHYFWSQGINPHTLNNVAVPGQVIITETVEVDEQGRERVLSASPPTHGPATSPPGRADRSAAGGSYATRQDLKRVERKADQAGRQAKGAQKAVRIMDEALRRNSR